MRTQFTWLLFFLLLVCTNATFSGPLVYRDGLGGHNCSITTSSSGGTTTKTLVCNGKQISKHVESCALRGGCAIARVHISGEHDFNYDIPGIESDSNIFGSVSQKSVANAFAHRALSEYYLTYSNDGVLDKPVIFVEGYDPQNSVFPDFYYDRGISNLVFDGRDLIIVDFSDGSEDMDSNAVLLQSIIEEINNAKTGSHPLQLSATAWEALLPEKHSKIWNWLL